MTQVLVILALLAMHASASGSWGAAIPLPAWLVAAATLGPVLLGWLAAHVVCLWSGRAMDRGQGRAALRADRAASWFRGFACLWLAGTSLATGWPGSLGEVLGAGYLALVLGALGLAGLLWASWWSLAPVDRRLRESTRSGDWRWARRSGRSRGQRRSPRLACATAC